MTAIHTVRQFLVKQGFEDDGFSEKQMVSMPDGNFKIALLYAPGKKREAPLPSSNKKRDLLSAAKEVTCYIETGKLMHNAKRLAYMMCSSLFVWMTTKEEFDSANQWFKIAFQRSLTEFVFAEEAIGKETVYFFKGCPDITMREQI